MKPLILLISLILFAGCRETHKNNIDNNNSDSLGLEISDNQSSLFKNKSNVDTIRFENRNGECIEQATATLLKKEYGKDSICIADFRLDFLKGNKIIYSHNVTIDGFDEGSDWYGNVELDSVLPSMRTVSVGFPACGYSHKNFLFFIDKAAPDLIHEWYSMGDGGWGLGTEIISGTAKDFCCRTVSFSPKDDGKEDVGIVEYSDSIHFELKDHKWYKTFLTPKDTVYRKKEMAFNEFHSSN